MARRLPSRWLSVRITRARRRRAVLAPIARWTRHARAARVPRRDGRGRGGHDSSRRTAIHDSWRGPRRSGSARRRGVRVRSAFVCGTRRLEGTRPARIRQFGDVSDLPAHARVQHRLADLAAAQRLRTTDGLDQIVARVRGPARPQSGHGRELSEPRRICDGGARRDRRLERHARHRRAESEELPF